MKDASVKEAVTQQLFSGLCLFTGNPVALVDQRQSRGSQHVAEFEECLMHSVIGWAFCDFDHLIP